MSTTQMRREDANQTPTAEGIETKLEVVILPVSDVDRSKRFYQSLGWRLDGDFVDAEDWRAVQMTPPGSQCSIIFGKGITTALPGSVQGTFLVVDEIKAARADLIARGVAVSEAFHFDTGIHVVGTEGRAPGPDPQGRPYSTWTSFSDPDGNTWLLQEVKTRLPGRMSPGRDFVMDAATLTELLQETEERHGAYEATAPKHHWSLWYAGYLLARVHGKTPDEAAKEAALRVDAMRH
jgi:catechol 2,3-dioxygenase-like lactoylglutathione lyase family enzyme